MSCRMLDIAAVYCCLHLIGCLVRSCVDPFSAGWVCHLVWAGGDLVCVSQYFWYTSAMLMLGSARLECFDDWWAKRVT